MKYPAVIRQIGTYFLVLACSAFASLSSAAADETLLLSDPSLSADHLAFVYAGDIWVSNRDGRQARRLTSHPASESAPQFSPDGQWVAFSADRDDNIDVYVMPTAGGQPKRLTWHPGTDVVNGWTPDGTKIVFASRREILIGRSNQIFEVPLTGGFPEKMMEAVAFEGVWSGNGRRFAYRPYRQAHSGASGWHQYRGGATPPIWIMDPETQALEKVPHDGVNDTNPMWVGDSVYFLSDRGGSINIHSYDSSTKTVRQVTDESLWDIRSADAEGDIIAYEVGGRLKFLNTYDGAVTEVSISISPDLPQLRPQWKDASKTIQSIGLSPTGKRALLTARGDIYTVPLEDGSTRNLTVTSGVREKDALWSPDGQQIAYITDQGGEQSLVIIRQTGDGAAKTLALGDPTDYALLNWSNDGARIVFADNHLRLFAIDIGSGKRTLLDTSDYRADRTVASSPDGRWLAFTRTGSNYLDTVVLYDFETGDRATLTDPLVHAGAPAFSHDGQYLYFTASINAGPSQVGLDMSSQEKPRRSAIYVAALAADGRSPLLPETGDENEDDDAVENKDEDKDDEDEPEPVTVSLTGLPSRIAALPVAERNYDSLASSHSGALFYIERSQPGASHEPPGENGADGTLFRFDFEEKETTAVMQKVAAYAFSRDGKKIIVQGPGSKILIAEPGEEMKGEPLDVSDVKAFVDPGEEWRQIFDEVWRFERDYFYAANMHGLDWTAVRDQYRPLVDHVGRREDLNTLMIEMIGELQVGHNRIRGGDQHREKKVPVGLLGADLRLEQNRYRINRIYAGDLWSPFIKSPLAAAGLGVNEGDYILAVNGRDLTGDDNIHDVLTGTVGKQVTLTINSRPLNKDARTVIVEPVASESPLRRWAWVEDNRARVSAATEGRVGYVYLPNTAGTGYTYFNRMFFAQADKQAMIIDERSNGGGQAANYVTDVLSRTYLAGWMDRDGLISSTPGGGIYGPKVMLIDQDAGSGGDFLPYSFRRMEIGPLIGTRTWGGLIGIAANPRLIDGGSVSVPYFRFFTPEGEWRIENEGIAPDIEVELDPVAVNAGRDTQLESAIETALQGLADHTPVRRDKAPPLPTRVGD